jgi:hypothetical protein
VWLPQGPEVGGGLMVFICIRCGKGFKDFGDFTDCVERHQREG